MDNKGWVQEYEKRLPDYKRCLARLEPLLKDLLSGAEIKVNAYEFRVKEVSSFAEKIAREGKNYTNPLLEITDIVGARVILYYLDDVDRVCKVLRQEFDIDIKKSVDKRETLAADQFGYVSVHKVVSLSKERAQLTEWAAWKDVQFEVQVRTVLQHSWAAIDHALRYKVKTDVPKTSLRRLMRLSGLLELADQEFAELRKEREIAIKVAEGEFRKGNTAVSIDKLSIGAYVRSSPLTQTVEGAAKAAGLGVVGTADSAGDSHLASVASLLNLKTIQDVDAALAEAIGGAADFFSHFVEGSGRSIQGSVPHFMAVLLAGSHHQSLEATRLHEVTGWNLGYSTRALKTGERAFTQKRLTSPS